MKKSIVIPTYNHLDDLLKPCCESIIKYTDLSDVEVIIVANGCKDKTREYVESLGTSFRLVWRDEGMGFTKATNLGVKESTGDIVVLMNNDVVLLPQDKNEWMRFLCDPLKDNVGMTGNLKIWEEHVERMFLVGFLVAIPRWLWNRVGGFDEDWSPGGGEDIELCLQVENLGYKIIQVPDEINIIQNGLNVNRFMSYHAGEGTMLDEEHKVKWNEHIKWVRERLATKYKLPKGWFYKGDLSEYRRLVEDVPKGGTIGELGCAWGRSLCSVADIIKRKDLKVHIVDCFIGTTGEASYGDKFRKEFEDNITRFGIFDRVTIHEGYTNDMVKEIPDHTFDLLFIDADHSYEVVKKDLIDWEPKIKIHGTISGHDYSNGFGVSQAVNERYIEGIRVNDEHFGIDSGIAEGSVWSVRL
jgi:GT2 family glycosyltransferase